MEQVPDGNESAQQAENPSSRETGPNDTEYWKAAFKGIVSATSLGLYGSNAGPDGAPRTAKQDGYNDAAMEIEDAIEQYVERCCSLENDSVHRMKACLVAEEPAWWTEGGGIAVNLSDVFAWGCADAEDVSDADVPLVYRIWKRHGTPGIIAWAARKRDQIPQACLLPQSEVYDSVGAMMSEHR